MFRREVITHIDIEASPGEIWRHLTDFAAYPEWNPYLSGIEGKASAGSGLVLKMGQSGGREVAAKVTVTTAQPGRKLVWRGRTLIPGLLDNEHSFVIEDHGGETCRLTQSEVFTGFLAFFLPRSLGQQTSLGFEMFNEVLKKRVEGKRQDSGQRAGAG
ncbi:MAG: SRPBCC domain-containing protein [Proteobacteria bacterium]|nr:SRPBCC domain-containing protein [Pseudomonadota bacterium]